MKSIDLKDFQQNLEATFNRLEAGEILTIARDGRAIDEIHPLADPLDAPRPVGLAAGLFVVPGDFDAPLPEDVLQAFEV